MKVQEMKLADIKPYENNPRNNEEAVEYVANSIREFGWQQPLVVDKDLVIIAGHTRYKAALKLGLDSAPVVIADNLTEEQVKAYRLADNKTAEAATWNEAALLAELGEIAIDMTMFGFDPKMIAGEDPEILEDDVPDVEETTETKRGDIFILGDHRLMCGDSTSEEDIEKLMEGGRAAVCLTDPPYGIDVVQGNGKVGADNQTHFKGRVGGENIVKSHEYMPIIGDDSTETAEKNFEIIKGYTDNQILFGGNYFTEFLKPSRCWIVWDKQNTGNFADAELAWTSFDKGVKLYRFMWNGLVREGSRNVEGKTRIHPTQKPVGLMGYILKDFTKDGDNVVDCFGGSGSTLIACEQLNRKCFMMELSPEYCDVIVKRWENLTGRKAVKLET